jgi:hypothetical protein
MTDEIFVPTNSVDGRSSNWNRECIIIVAAALGVSYFGTMTLSGYSGYRSLD